MCIERGVYTARDIERGKCIARDRERQGATKRESTDGAATAQRAAIDTRPRALRFRNTPLKRPPLGSIR